MSTSKNFFEAVKERRSYYAISKESPVSDERIEEVVKEAIQNTPSAFNSQSSRVVVLFGANHDRQWDATLEALRPFVPAEQFGQTEERINGFKNGFGTVLFFEDQDVVKGLQEQFALYADNFPVWSEQSSGMLQFVVWTALEQEGLGASLQHYNPLVNEFVHANWDVPSNWKLTGQMPFGKPFAPAGEKAFQPVEGKVKVFK